MINSARATLKIAHLRHIGWGAIARLRVGWLHILVSGCEQAIDRDAIIREGCHAIAERYAEIGTDQWLDAIEDHFTLDAAGLRANNYYLIGLLAEKDLVGFA